MGEQLIAPVGFSVLKYCVYDLSALFQDCSDVLVSCVTIIIDGFLTSNAEYSATVLVLVIIRLKLHIHGLHITQVQSANLKAILMYYNRLNHKHDIAMAKTWRSQLSYDLTSLHTVTQN